MPESWEDRRPLRIGLVNDYEVVLAGIAHLLDRYRDRVVVAEIDVNEGTHQPLDVVLYDNFAQGEADQEDLASLIASPLATRVAVYTWNLQEELVREALRKGACGYLSKALPVCDIVDALERIHRGEIVVRTSTPADQLTAGQDWPGRSEGLSERESEVLALITQGKSNAEISALTYLSSNTIKTYIRSTYRKIGVTSRTKAVLWGIEHGFKPERRSIEYWQP
jgi:DNA-binding NarL/FixJ family response regulator